MFKSIWIYAVLIYCCSTKPQQQNIEDTIAEIFTSPSPIETSSRRGGFAEIVTPEPILGLTPDSLFVGETDGLNCKCVPYYLCNPTNNSVVEEVDGFGRIDISTTASCADVLDVCCGEQKIQEKSIPVRPVAKKPNRANGCGIRNPEGIDFELQGNLNNEAEFGEFPWTIALINIPDGKYFCGASLIHPQVVLTANHCVRKLNPRSFKIRAGEWDTQTIKERLPFQERSVARIINHPDYSIETVANDFALVLLQEPVELTDHINVVCLPPPNYISNNPDCYVSSWGKDIFGIEGKHSVIMKKVRIPIIPNDQCELSLRNTKVGATFKLSPTFICAGGKKGEDSCEGDGGGPLVCPVGPATENRYAQNGIVAWGIGCNEARPAVYARVAVARDWIDSQMRNLGYDPAVYTY